MLWNCVVDKVGSIMISDDIAIAVTDKDPHIAIRQLQEVLDDIAIWARMEGLKLNVSKTPSLIFNKKEAIPTPLVWEGQLLSYQDNATYLGVRLNDRCSG
jgi:hypothetical protein